MSKHFLISFLFITSLIICYIYSFPAYAYIAVFLFFLVMTAWGAFDIRLSYFVKTTCYIKNRPQKTVVLTFDDGATTLTTSFLDTLKKFNAKAIFFCIGRQIEKHPEIVKRIQNEGHLIGNHTFNHIPKNTFASTKTFIEEIEKTDAALAKLGIQTELFRPPYGVTNPHIAKAIKLTNKKVVGWDIRSLDTVIQNEDALFKRIISKLSHGNIILMHDTNQHTLNILERLLRYLTENNYQITTDLNLN